MRTMFDGCAGRVVERRLGDRRRLLWRLGASGLASSDLASSDLASPDLASSDLASSDQASSDLASSDLASYDIYRWGTVSTEEASWLKRGWAAVRPPIVEHLIAVAS